MNGKQLFSALAAITVATAIASTTIAAPTFLNGPSRNAVYDTTGIAELSGTKWQFKTGGLVHASPIGDAKTIYIGSGDGNFYALDRQTGKEKWRFETGAAIHSTAALADGNIYFLSRDGHLYALDSKTGEKIWAFKTGGEPRYSSTEFSFLPSGKPYEDVWDFLMSSPLVHEGSVYFGSADGHLYALEAKTGKQKWAYKADDAINSSPAISGDTLLIGDLSGILHAVSAHDGSALWQYKNAGRGAYSEPIMATPVIANGMAYFGSRDSRMRAIDIKTGEQKWEYFLGGTWVIGSALVDGGAVYFGSTNGKALHALDIETGQPIFVRRAKGFVYSSPALSNGMIYFGSFDGRLNAVRASDGTPLWTYETQGHKEHKDSFLSVTGVLNLKKVNNRVVVDSNDFDIFDSVLTKAQSIGSIISTALVADGVIYFGAGDGYIYAIEGN